MHRLPTITNSGILKLSLGSAWNYKYDGADQLLSAVKSNTSTQTILNQYFYGYDQGSNRTTEQVGLDVTQSTFNNVNPYGASISEKNAS
jgi:YD repeat-containing protein